jgi:hypothetical protein
VKMLFGSNQINTGDTVYLKTKTVERLAVDVKGDFLRPSLRHYDGSAHGDGNKKPPEGGL